MEFAAAGPASRLRPHIGRPLNQAPVLLELNNIPQPLRAR